MWQAGRVRALRKFLSMTQEELALELGTRQQTISEWETGQYRPRGASARLLSIVADRAGFRYQAGTGGGERKGRAPVRSAVPAGESVALAVPTACGEGESSSGSSLLRLSEADLAYLWEGQRFPPEALSTRDGAPLRMVYRGRSQRGPGPDFRDAIIATGSALLSGDIELHVHASDFRRHGHHLDPAYDAVILHVVFWDDGSRRNN